MLIQTAAATALLAIGWQPTGLRWAPGQFPIPYCVSANGTNTNVSAQGQRTAILNAIGAWVNTNNGGGLSCTTYDAAPAGFGCTVGINTNDGEPNIFFEDNWSNGSGAIGVTWSTGTGQFCGNVTDDVGQSWQQGCKYDADIELNDRDYFWTNDGSATDIQSIAVHEYGHFIGLDHCTNNNTCQVGTGIMAAAYPGGNIRALFNDDVQGGCGLYPGTPGGTGWPCSQNNQCNSGICVNPGNNGYCSETCGTCPQGFVCDANPGNPAQMVCLRDDGLNKDSCEVCQIGLPGACINNGICARGLPSNTEGRCVLPCGTNRSCPTDYQCLTVQFQDGSSGDFCFPGSNDCNDPGNFTELQEGQTCTGNPPCAAGLECIGSGTAGICARDCTNNAGACAQAPGPTIWSCADFQGGVSFCLPSVNEGQACEGNVACSVGPCLITTSGGSATCFRDCAGDPTVCNNAQACNTYNLQGGGTVSICEPPGVPPNPPDAGVTFPDASVDTDGGPIDPDGGAGGDGGMKPPDAGQTPQNCDCDTTFSCDPNCGHCDPECSCDCDLTTACDPGCGSCDPECIDDYEGSGCIGCTSTHAPGDPLFSSLVALLLTGLFLSRKRR